MRAFWRLIWNLSERIHIPLGRFAPTVLGKMLGSKPIRVETTEEN